MTSVYNYMNVLSPGACGAIWWHQCRVSWGPECSERSQGKFLFSLFQAIDDDCNQTAQILSTLLNWSQVMLEQGRSLNLHPINLNLVLNLFFLCASH